MQWTTIRRCQLGLTYISLAVVASQISKITRNSEKIRTICSSRLFKVIDHGANRKRIGPMQLSMSLIVTLLSIHVKLFYRVSYRITTI